MKKFVIKISFALLPLLILFFLGYYLVKIHRWGGDIGVLGRYFFEQNYIKKWHYSKKGGDYVKAISFDTHLNKKYDIIFIGDSFTNYAENSYGFKSVFSNLLKDSVLYDKSWKISNPEQRFVNMLRNNDSLPRFAIVESVERDFIKRLSDLDFNYDIQAVSETKPNKKGGQDISQDIKLILDMYKKILGFYDNPIKRANLAYNKFSAKGDEKKLYFYFADLNFPESNDIDYALQKLDTLNNMANQKGVTLIYMVACDKYDFYQKYIVDNMFPPQKTLDDFSSKVRIPHFINTKKVLDSADKQGIIDIYWVDDTHWSQTGSRIVGEYLYNYMKNFPDF